MMEYCGYDYVVRPGSRGLSRRHWMWTVYDKPGSAQPIKQGETTGSEAAAHQDARDAIGKLPPKPQPGAE